jgi:hypothetical protein
VIAFGNILVINLKTAKAIGLEIGLLDSIVAYAALATDFFNTIGGQVLARPRFGETASQRPYERSVIL